MSDIKIFSRLFRAVDEPELCSEYVKGHHKVLIDYGVINVTSGIPDWIHNPNVYCIVAFNEQNVMIGGIRVQLGDGIHPLPIETAIGSIDPGIYRLVARYLKEGVGELCGLWNAKEVAGRGISMILTRAAISIINQLKFKTLMGICAEYTMEMFTRVGFVTDTSLGKNGEFPYPNENYITKVLGILNAATLETAYEYDRERMLTLREKPVQVRPEEGPKGQVIVDYNLALTLKNS